MNSCPTVCAMALCLTLVSAHTSTAAKDAPPPATRLRWSLSQESWSVQPGEKLGMAAGRALLEVAPNVHLGAATYGAVRGQRGGFITLGPEIQWTPPLTDTLNANVGLFVGAGGGRDGLSLAGGGLMLRTQLGLERPLPGGHRVGLGLSRVVFPDGIIRSTQAYASYAYAFDSQLQTGWAEPGKAWPSASWPGLQEQDVSVQWQRWQAGARTTGATPSPRPMDLLGVGWTGYLSPHWYLVVQSHGALGGGHAGYMQILPGAGYRWPLGHGHNLQVQATLGPAGGGAIDTGGGTLVNTRLLWQWRLWPHQSLQLSLGSVDAPGSKLHTLSAGLALVHHLQEARTTGSQPGNEAPSTETSRWRLRLSQQHYQGSRPDWRCCNAATPIDNLGLQLDYMLSPHQNARQWYLTGQGIAAYHGRAGAYMTGLLGLGVHQPLSARWHLEAEALSGAAGGGGVNTGSGWVGQLNAALGYQLTPQLGLQLSAGQIRAIHAPLRARVHGLSLVYRFARQGAR